MKGLRVRPGQLSGNKANSRECTLHVHLLTVEVLRRQQNLPYKVHLTGGGHTTLATNHTGSLVSRDALLRTCLGVTKW